jgi:hypothetical protein
MLTIILDSKYQCHQFDDWLAGGKIKYKGKTYYWSAQDSNYGFGWEVEPITDDDWNDISENEFNKIITFIKRCLYEHKTEYTIGYP